MKTTVFLVRHGSHDRLQQVLCGRTPGVCLGDAGRRQAGRLAARFGDESLAAVYSSPLERALETAGPIADAAGLRVQTAKDLQELDYGDWSGRSFAALSEDPAWAAWNADKGRGRPPGGESLAELQGRLSRWLHEVRRRHPDEAVVAVSHAEPIKTALLWVLGAPFDALGRFEISPASTSVVVCGAWGFKVHNVNQEVP